MIIMDYNMNVMNGNEATKIVLYIIYRLKIQYKDKFAKMYIQSVIALMTTRKQQMIL